MVRWMKRLLALLFMLSILSMNDTARAASQEQLTIVYQSDFKGYVEGCG